LIEAAGAHWVEAVSDSFFEDSRTGDDELWGTVLVDGMAWLKSLVPLC